MSEQNHKDAEVLGRLAYVETRLSALEDPVYLVPRSQLRIRAMIAIFAVALIAYCVAVALGGRRAARE